MVVIVFGCSYSKHQDKYCCTKLLPLLPFSLLPTIKSLLCHSFSFTTSSPALEDEKKAVCLCRSRKAIQKKIGNQNANFQFFVMPFSSYGRECCLKKILFPHGFYCQKAVNQFLRNTKDVWWERQMARSTQTCFFSSLFFFLFLPIVAHRKSFKWHLTVLLTADMANSS